MLAWLNQLSTLQHVFLYIAIPATITVIVQCVIFLLSTSNDAEIVGSNSENRRDSKKSTVVVRAIATSIAVTAWAAVSLLSFEIMSAVAVMLAVLLGTISFILTILALQWCIKINENEIINITDTVGLKGEASLIIPPYEWGAGKISVTVNKKQCEFTAVTDAKVAIIPGQPVEITGVKDDNTLIVKPIIQ